MKKILVPHDFSNAAENALKYAAFYCDNREDLEIKTLYVTPTDVSANEEAAIIDRLKDEYQSIQTTAKISSMVAPGELNATIAKVQKEGAFDIIIMGTGGSEEVEEMARTNTSRLVLDVDAPVLVIPDHYSDFSIKNIALALGKDEIDDSLSLDILHHTARYFNAKVHVLTIEAPGTDNQVQADSNQNILEYYLETIDYQYSFPENSDIEEGINQYIAEKDVDLLAILPRNHAKNTRPSAGRLTKLLTLHARTPILVID